MQFYHFYRHLDKALSRGNGAYQAHDWYKAFLNYPPGCVSPGLGLPKWYSLPAVANSQQIGQRPVKFVLQKEGEAAVFSIPGILPKIIKYMRIRQLFEFNKKSNVSVLRMVMVKLPLLDYFCTRENGYKKF